MRRTRPRRATRTSGATIAFDDDATRSRRFPPTELEAARTAGADATPEQLELLAAETQIKQIINGIPARSRPASAGYTEAGFTAEQFEAAKTELDAQGHEQVTGSADEAPSSPSSSASRSCRLPPETPTQ